MATLTSCGGDDEPPEPALGTPEVRALVQVEEVPEGVSCIRVTVTGSDRIMRFSMPVSPGVRSSLSASALPTGKVRFEGEAFEKPCSAITDTDVAGWRSDPVDQTLAAGAPVILTLKLRRNGVADVRFGFEFARACVPGGFVCAANEICFVLACGDAQGGCLTRPTTCPQQYDPVCGCDGATYSNACEAAKAGKSVAYEGPCTCGGPEDTTCSPGFACVYPAGTCSVSGRRGVCSAAPVACPTFKEPVCACNARTYDNACLAEAAGQSIDHTGPCVPQVCGGPNRTRCNDPTMFCSYADGTCADPNRFGVCIVRPLACPVRLSPVCGCDGREYQSECRAQAVAMSLSSRGPCPMP